MISHFNLVIRKAELELFSTLAFSIFCLCTWKIPVDITLTKRYLKGLSYFLSFMVSLLVYNSLTTDSWNWKYKLYRMECYHLHVICNLVFFFFLLFLWRLRRTCKLVFSLWSVCTAYPSFVKMAQLFLISFTPFVHNWVHLGHICGSFSFLVICVSPCDAGVFTQSNLRVVFLLCSSFWGSDVFCMQKIQIVLSYLMNCLIK